MSRHKKPEFWAPDGARLRSRPKCSIVDCEAEGKAVYGGMCLRHCNQYGPDVPGDVLTWPDANQIRENLRIISEQGYIGLLPEDVRERFYARSR